MGPRVRDLFIPAAMRKYLNGLIRGRKSTTSPKLKETPGPVRSCSIAYPADEEVTTCHSSPGYSREAQLVPDGNTLRIDSSATTAHITTAITSESSTDTSDVLRVRPNSKVQPLTACAEVLNQVADNTDEQNLCHIAAISHDSAILDQKQRPTKDSGYACGNDIQVAFTGSQVRRMRRLIAEKCKKIWRKASDVTLDVQCRDNIDSNDVETDCNGGQDHHNSDSSTADDVNDDEERSSNDSDADDDDCDQHLRCDFKAIKATKNELFEALARSFCETDDIVCEVRVVGRTQGTYNFVATVSVSHGEEVERYVVRVPGHATLTHWTPEDAYMLEREAQLIEHIRKNTSAPVAKIIHYSTDHTNILGFPYIFMTALPGNPASEIWYDGDYEDDDFELAFQHADIPSVATEKKRITFLRSLARTMTELQSLTFDMIGMPVLSEAEGTTIGPIHHWGNNGSDRVWTYRPCNSTVGYGYAGVGRQFAGLIGRQGMSDLMHRGAIKFFNIFFGQPVFKTTQPETFTIHHDDLDLQNIFVDEEGNITGIIDWDKAFAAPRCISTAAAPLFLQKDWLPDYINNLGNGPHMGWKMHSYREVYAAALQEAGNSDAMYTINSAMYRAAFMAVREMDGCMYDFMDKMLREVPHCRIKAADFAQALALGWQDAEDMLKIEFAKILEPQLPRPNLLAELDADIAMKDWWSTLKDYSVEVGDETDCGSISESEAVTER